MFCCDCCVFMINILSWREELLSIASDFVTKLLVEYQRSNTWFFNVIDNCVIDKYETKTNIYNVFMLISTFVINAFLGVQAQWATLFPRMFH